MRDDGVGTAQQRDVDPEGGRLVGIVGNPALGGA